MIIIRIRSQIGIKKSLVSSSFSPIAKYHVELRNQEELHVQLDGYAITERPNDLPNYCLIDLNVGKELTLTKKDGQKVKLDFSVKNILDQQPEMVSGFPITGRTYTAGISFEF